MKLWAFFTVLFVVVSFVVEQFIIAWHSLNTRWQYVYTAVRSVFWSVWQYDCSLQLYLIHCVAACLSQTEFGTSIENIYDNFIKKINVVLPTD